MLISITEAISCELYKYHCVGGRNQLTNLQGFQAKLDHHIQMLSLSSVPVNVMYSSNYASGYLFNFSCDTRRLALLLDASRLVSGL